MPRLVRILIYDGTDQFIHGSLVRRGVKESYITSQGTITEFLLESGTFRPASSIDTLINSLTPPTPKDPS
jgi:hypothetical protein